MKSWVLPVCTPQKDAGELASPKGGLSRSYVNSL